MYRKRPNLTIGFHGCDLPVRNDLVSNPDKVKKSQEKFDWLGNEHDVDVHSLPSGLYILTLNFETDTKALKFIRQ